jgi:hypothetical protein
MKTDNSNEPSSHWVYDIEQEGQAMMPRAVSFEYVLDKLDAIDLDSGSSLVCYDAKFTINCLLSEAYRRLGEVSNSKFSEFINKFQGYRDKVYCVKKNASELYNVTAHTTSAGLFKILHPDRELQVDDDLVELMSTLHVHNDLMENDDGHFDEMLAKWKSFQTINGRTPSPVSEDTEEQLIGKWFETVSTTPLVYGQAKQIVDTESWPNPIRVRVF